MLVGRDGRSNADLAKQRNIPFELWVRGANNPAGDCPHQTIAGRGEAR
jgi:hypothetical protein